MKNKRNVLIAFILICCLCLSIGYAALTDTLYVEGAMTIDTDSNTDNNPEKAFNEDVYYANAVVATSGDEVGTAFNTWAVIGADTNGDANDKLTITVPAGILNVKGDKVTVTVDIKNDSKDLTADVVLNTITNSNSEFFAVSAGWTQQNFNGTIAAEGSANVTITIELAKSPTSDVSGTFSFTHTATADDNDPATT